MLIYYILMYMYNKKSKFNITNYKYCVCVCVCNKFEFAGIIYRLSKCFHLDFFEGMKLVKD